MRPSEALTLYRTEIREIALRHRVSGVRVFGSALLGDDEAGSDLDLLVEPTAQTTLMDIGAIRFELKKTVGNGGGRPHPQRAARPLSRTGPSGCQAGMSRADPLRVADLPTLQRQVAALA